MLLKYFANYISKHYISRIYLKVSYIHQQSKSIYHHTLIICTYPITHKTQDPKNKYGGGKGSLGRHDFSSKDPEFVKHLQLMLVRPGCDPGICGLDKDGVNRDFGKLANPAVNDLLEMKQTPSVILVFSKICRNAAKSSHFEKTKYDMIN